MALKEVDATLVPILQESLGLHVQLLELLKVEHEVLVRHPKELASVTSKKETLLKQLAEMEKTRRLALVNVAAEYNIKLKEATLSRLAQVSGNQQYETLRQSFKHILAQIVNFQSKNHVLIEQGLAVTNEVIEVLYAAQEGPLYGPAGLDNENKSPNKYVDGHI